MRGGVRGMPSATGSAGPPSGVVLVVDDHELVGALIVLALVGRGLDAHRCPLTSVAGILAEAETLGRGLVLLDLDLGLGTDGVPVDEIELVRGFCERGWRTLVVSAATDERAVAAAVAAGAIGFVAKAVPLENMLDTVSEAAAGHAVITPAERAYWLEIHRHAQAAARVRRARLRRLTVREREILDLLARGERAAVIAEEAVVSLTTVRSQIRSILTKLEVNSQLEAVAFIRDELDGNHRGGH